MHTIQQLEPPAATTPGTNVTGPNRGQGVLQQQKPGMRTPLCGACESQIRCDEEKCFPFASYFHLLEVSNKSCLIFCLEIPNVIHKTFLISCDAFEITK